MFSHHENPREHTTCDCGRGLCIVKCYDCFQYPVLCKSCFIETHCRAPLHWAYIWSGSRCFQRFDYTAVASNEHHPDTAIQLGHLGEPCPNPGTTVGFIIVHINGIHSTKIRYCECYDIYPDKLIQLMHARLFHGTASNPGLAFTFEVLEQFHIHNLQSKCGAYDYTLSLRRLSDDAFTDHIPVSIAIHL